MDELGAFLLFSASIARYGAAERSIRDNVETFLSAIGDAVLEGKEPITARD
jgi:hypothetical protein